MNKRQTILIVDDVSSNRLILKTILEDKYNILEASCGIECIEILNTNNNVSVVLLDVMMPNMDGYETLQHMKQQDKTKNIPVIFITSSLDELKGLQLGAIDYINKPFSTDNILLRINNILELSLQKENLERIVSTNVQSLQNAKINFLDILSQLFKYRSIETYVHNQNTSILTEILMKKMFELNIYTDILVPTDYILIPKAAPMHDIGKICIPDTILAKPIHLTVEEKKQIEEHTTLGANIIKSIMEDNSENDDFLLHCFNLCMYHHENFDGSGYPMGLKGNSIPLSARIVSLVDTYDALTSKRAYKEELTHEKSVSLINQLSGYKFDPCIVKAFNECSNDFKKSNDSIKRKI